MAPFTIKLKEYGTYQDVPCGKCPACLARRVSAWSFRLMQEDKRSVISSFITLTYDTQYVPITARGYLTYDYRHVRQFFKGIRQDVARSGKVLPSIRYYCVAEYGGKTNRPHFHIIAFNVPPELAEKHWKYGSIHIGKVEGASVGYTLKYISKPQCIPAHENDDRKPPRAWCSKGLGSNYITDDVKRWHNANLEERLYLPGPDGEKYPLPRYYRERIAQRHEVRNAAFFAQQKMKEKARPMTKLEQQQYKAACAQAWRKQQSKRHNEKL